MQPILDDEDAIPFPEGSFSRQKYIQVTEGQIVSTAWQRRLESRRFSVLSRCSIPLSQKSKASNLRKGRWHTLVEALRQATSTAAELLALSGPRTPYSKGQLGVIKRGAYADLILVNGNPLENLDLVADPENNFVVIMKDGKVYKNTLQ